jgi:hypothetical protein
MQLDSLRSKSRLVASLLVLFGAIGPAFGAGEGSLTKEGAAKQTRLRSVVAELRARDASGMTAEKRAARTRAIDLLSEYAEQAHFTVHHMAWPRTQPLFIDEFGTRCALASVLDGFGEDTVVQRLAVECNDAYLAEIPDDPDVARVLDELGLTIDEAAYIQGPGEQRTQQRFNGATAPRYTAPDAGNSAPSTSSTTPTTPTTTPENRRRRRIRQRRPERRGSGDAGRPVRPRPAPKTGAPPWRTARPGVPDGAAERTDRRHARAARSTIRSSSTLTCSPVRRASRCRSRSAARSRSQPCLGPLRTNAARRRTWLQTIRKIRPGLTR